ncbi:MAG TPA: nuclear transport factor 2 family protein [Solirubrobacteraceae bacterium]|nr:nuclear transport factor 2 family protein [Solirubrobacteraceae bacterium]
MSSASDTAVSTAERFRAAVERKDLAAAGELLAPEIVFHSPVTFHPFIGRDTVRRLLAEVIQVFTDFRYTDELEMDGAHALIFRAGVAGTDREIEGIDLLRFDEQGLIADFTVMLRPLSALVPFAQAMGERAQAAGLQTTRV